MTDTRTEPNPYNERYFIWTHAHAWTNFADEDYAAWFVELYFDTPEGDRWLLRHDVEYPRFLAERS